MFKPVTDTGDAQPLERRLDTTNTEGATDTAALFTADSSVNSSYVLVATLQMCKTMRILHVYTPCVSSMRILANHLLSLVRSLVMISTQYSQF
jgi:hypothetical protein